MLNHLPMVTSPSLINEKQHFIKFSTAGYIPYLVNEKYEILFIKLFLHFLIFFLHFFNFFLQHLWLHPLPWRRGEVGRQRGWRWSLLLWFWWWGAIIIIFIIITIVITLVILILTWKCCKWGDSGDAEKNLVHWYDDMCIVCTVVYVKVQWYSDICSAMALPIL